MEKVIYSFVISVDGIESSDEDENFNNSNNKWSHSSDSELICPWATDKWESWYNPAYTIAFLRLAFFSSLDSSSSNSSHKLTNSMAWEPSINYVTWISWFFYPSQVVTFLRTPTPYLVWCHIFFNFTPRNY